MRRLLQIILLKPIIWVSKKFASRPDKQRIFTSLTNLLHHINGHPYKKGITITAGENQRFIIFSDQHRGAKNGADDFMHAEPVYLSALNYYYNEGYYFISLGDSEELWENSLAAIRKHNISTFNTEKKFIRENRFYKVLGNHDLFWGNDPLAGWYLKKIYGNEVKVYEGLVIQQAINNKHLTIFLTHGHQGDAASDGNWLSKFFVARIWAPLQAYLRINPNTPAYRQDMKSLHNRIMYEWSAGQEKTILITGHTHQPVFESLTFLERLLERMNNAKEKNRTEEVNRIAEELARRGKAGLALSHIHVKMKPSYFNSGCCCYQDGDITGIEITSESIYLVKWSREGGREILEKEKIISLANRL